MTKYIRQFIKDNLPYYGPIKTKGRYSGVKAKAWGIVSDYTRCRDFILYKTCVATGNRISDWREADAGHYIAMSSHGALIGFDVLNIHMQSKISNKLSSAEDGAYFKNTLVERYGDGIIKHLNSVKLETVKADDFFFIKKIQEVWRLFQELKIQYPSHNYPEYLSGDN